MIKVAIIGAGTDAQEHVKSFKEFEETCCIVAICDVHIQRAKDLAEQYDLNVEIYDNYLELLEQSDIDVVSICASVHVRGEIAINALKKGKHVLVETPMATSIVESDNMIAAAHQNQCFLSVVSPKRFASSMVKLQYVLQTELIGPIKHVQIDSNWWRGDINCAKKDCTVKFSANHLDLLHWFNGMPSQVTAVMSNVSHKNRNGEDIGIFIFKYENGSIAQLTSSIIHHGEEQQIIFQGDKARISIPWKVKATTSGGTGHPLANPELEKVIEDTFRSAPEVHYSDLSGQIHNFLSAIQGKNTLLVNGKQGRNTVELIEAIYQSSRSGKTVSLPLEKGQMKDY